MDWKDGVLDVYTDKDGGVLKAAGKEYTLERGKHVVEMCIRDRYYFMKAFSVFRNFATKY